MTHEQALPFVSIYDIMSFTSLAGSWPADNARRRDEASSRTALRGHGRGSHRAIRGRSCHIPTETLPSVAGLSRASVVPRSPAQAKLRPWMTLPPRRLLRWNDRSRAQLFERHGRIFRREPGHGGAAFHIGSIKKLERPCQPPFTSLMTTHPFEHQPAGCCRRAATP